jgi:hypothetical protein
MIHDRGHPHVNLINNVRLARAVGSIDPKLIQTVRSKLLSHEAVNLLESLDTILGQTCDAVPPEYSIAQPIENYVALRPPLKLLLSRNPTQEELLYASQQARKILVQVEKQTNV